MAEPMRTRLCFMGFDDETVARGVLDELKAGIRTKTIVVEDWAPVHKAVAGRLTITTDTSKDPGAGRGTAAGGAAGLRPGHRGVQPPRGGPTAAPRGPRSDGEHARP